MHINKMIQSIVIKQTYNLLDFDGDTVSVILVPEEAAEDTYKKMSPRYNKIYKKSLKNIFEFNHETLEINQGSINLT